MFPVHGDQVCPVSQRRASSFLSLEAINIFKDFSGVSLKLNNSLCLIYFFPLQVVQDWKFVAQVLDRMFLWAFLLVSILGSALLFIPVIYKWASIIVPNHETMVFGN